MQPFDTKCREIRASDYCWASQLKCRPTGNTVVIIVKLVVVWSISYLDSMLSFGWVICIEQRPVCSIKVHVSVFIHLYLVNWTWNHGRGHLGLDRERYIQQPTKTHKCGFRSSFHSHCRWSCYFHHWFHGLCWRTQRKHCPPLSSMML